MAKNDNLTDFLANIADAIRAKKGTTAPINAQNFASEISSIEGGSSGGNTSTVSQNDVTYYDYDGTMLYSYSADAFASLSEHPTLPERNGLVCQGWDWDLTKAKSYVNQYGALNIGATYITDDGKTRLYIKIAAEGRMDVPLYFSQTKANGVTIDWGDGSAIETLSSTGNKNTTHKYVSIGDYCITLSVASGCILGLGHNSSSYCILGSTSNNGKVYSNMLQRVEIGNGVTSIGNYAFYYCQSLASIAIPSKVTSIGNYVFNNCYSLASIVIPNGVTSIGNYAFCYCYSFASIAIPNSVISIGANAFYYCQSLASIAIPNSVTSIGDNAFYNCYSLASIVIPNGVKSISAYAFYYCYSLASVVIPNSVTSIGNGAFQNCQSLASIAIPSKVTRIGNSAFQNCYGMAFYDFSALTTVPSLSSTNAFSSIPSDCKIIVSDALYSTWKAATNWSTYASYIIKKSEWDALNV